MRKEISNLDEIPTGLGGIKSGSNRMLKSLNRVGSILGKGPPVKDSERDKESKKDKYFGEYLKVENEGKEDRNLEDNTDETLQAKESEEDRKDKEDKEVLDKIKENMAKQVEKQETNKENMGQNSGVSEITWGALFKSPKFVVVLLASMLVSAGIFTFATQAMINHKAKQESIRVQVEESNEVEREQKTDEDGTALTKFDVDAELPTEIPVVIGDRIDIKLDYKVQGSEHILNCTQSIGDKVYKVNYSDFYYPSFLNTPYGILFAQNDRTEEYQPCHLQVILPISEEEDLEKQITDAFEDVTEFAFEGSSIRFKAMDMQLSGFTREFRDPDNNRWRILSMIESDTPDEYCTNYANAVASSVGLYYNRRYAKPTQIEYDIVDDGLYIESQGIAVMVPRSGVNELETYGKELSRITMNREDLYGDNPIIFTTSKQEIYGFYEALKMVPAEIEKSYDTIYRQTGNVLKLDVQKKATWSDRDAYYLEGSIGNKRYVGYIFFNPVHNNYSSFGVFSDRSEQGVNCEKLINAMSEQIDFVGEVFE